MVQKNKIIIGVIFLNLILICLGAMDKGKMSFVSIPAILLINLIFIIYSLIKKNKRLIIIAFILLVASTIIAFVVFVHFMPFLTR